MKVLMLGWEYPPHISGGLGTACEGLTKSLADYGVEIEFVVPQLLGGEDASHMTLSSADGKVIGRSSRRKKRKNLTQISIPAFLTPYWNSKDYFRNIAARRSTRSRMHYGMDLFEEVRRYTDQVIEHMFSGNYDLIHAHDWMTFPAAVTLSQMTGKPLIAHIHSLEYDRSGSCKNPTIDSIEHQGLHAADGIIAVSYYTRSLLSSEHNIPLNEIAVIHNGVSFKKNGNGCKNGHKNGRTVLFLGRITFQKGPDYFIEAARIVADTLHDVRFIMAGSGDMLPSLQHRVNELGLTSSFTFPGFLKGEEVENAFSEADIYVMPSVSEPFGIAPLEAIRFDTPVIISRQSGVSEVISHALKVDFWDVHKLARYIIDALTYEELRHDMIAMAREEIQNLKWDVSAQKTISLYNQLV